MFCPRPSYIRSRRTATVMQSQPERASDRRIVSKVSYFPVPTISRLRSVCLPMRRGTSAADSMAGSARDIVIGSDSATAGESDDFELVAVGEPVLGVPRARDDLLVHFDCDAAAGKLQPAKQFRDGDRRGKLARLAVDDDGHACGSKRSEKNLFRILG